jgi:hypothetical protein
MYNKMKRFFLITLFLVSILAACNKDWKFPDYKYSTVYFPYQAPIRTLVLGEDLFDNTLDNERKFVIMATMGGVYENKKDVTLTVGVDNALTQRLKFDPNNGGGDIVAMPPNYYTLPQDMTIKIPAGKIMGGLEVQLTDAFFADPRSIKNTFVIPLKINSVTNADSILKGTSTKTSPDPRVAGDWGVAPKDYVLYAVKYINPYHGVYLRRGIDQVKGVGGNTALDTTIVYHNAFVERDEVCNLFTRSLTQDTISLNAKNRGNLNVPFRLVLSFDNAGKVTVSAPPSATFTASGTGEFVKKGDMWGEQKRDVLYLKYSVGFGTTTHNLTDTLVLRDRGVKLETFSPVF